MGVWVMANRKWQSDRPSRVHRLHGRWRTWGRTLHGRGETVGQPKWDLGELEKGHPGEQEVDGFLTTQALHGKEKDVLGPVASDGGLSFLERKSPQNTPV